MVIKINKTENCKFKARDNIPLYEFCLRGVSIEFTKDELRKVYLNGTTYDLSLHHSTVGKEDKINVREYLIVKSNVWIY